MARRSFSFMLAWRYLNPRRAMLSAVTIISVTGVLLGVWILVVVMSVFNGLESEVKNRLLGYTPHIKLEYAPGRVRKDLDNWREVAQTISSQPGVQSVTSFISDYVSLEVDGAIQPSSFRAIDTQDRAQVEGIDRMLDKKNYPEGTADMGLEKQVVISTHIAEGFHVGLGDTIKLYSLRNLEQVKTPYEIIGHEPVRDRYKDNFTAAKQILSGYLEKRGDEVLIPAEGYDHLRDFANVVLEDWDTLRQEEQEILNEFMESLQQVTDAPEGKWTAAEDVRKSLAFLKQLDGTDKDQMDLKALRRIKELVLPQEATVVGIFQPGKMAVMPDIFMPLPMAQQLAGLKDSVQSLAVRLDDSYQADRIARELLSKLGDDWFATTWFSEFGDFARLINQQRVMMYAVLSMIVIISAFSMMAVMFTVTIQKRREIGVMKALGAAPGQIVGVFLNQGIILGALGSVLGVGLGLVTLAIRGDIQELLRKLFKFDPFPADFNGFDVLPAVIVPKEVVWIAVAAFILCSLAAMLPAYVASRSDAAKSLRNL